MVTYIFLNPHKHILSIFILNIFQLICMIIIIYLYRYTDRSLHNYICTVYLYLKSIYRHLYISQDRNSANAYFLKVKF